MSYPYSPYAIRTRITAKDHPHYGETGELVGECTIMGDGGTFYMAYPREYETSKVRRPRAEKLSPPEDELDGDGLV